MKPLGLSIVVTGALAAISLATAWRISAQYAPVTVAQFAEKPAPITIDYPQDESIFPPDITAPTFLWRDGSKSARLWLIKVELAAGEPAIQVKSRGGRMRLGELDPRAVSDTNEPPTLTPEQAAAQAWKPEAQTWEAIKKHSVRRPAKVSITGFEDEDFSRAVSYGELNIQTSEDPVGAPIFYRDVPLMPSELEKGFIKPLAKSAVPLISWKLRNVHEPASRLLLTGMYTCANCHSFSGDGRTLGMDLDGPQNNKGMYTLASIQPQMTIRNEDVIEWSSFLGKQEGNVRLGFMSQVSPDGRHVVTMINGSEAGLKTPESKPRPPSKRKKVVSGFYVANFKDYRFLQVFYPTRGILAWYSRADGKLHTLPGAGNPRYVHTGAVWSPDGKYLVFSRAAARDPYVDGQPLAEHANDPNETQIQFDLYRIPFRGGEGGQPQPVAGASNNGMSNSFPKVSPDGRWIVFVQARNGQLMRPDSQLYIVPAEGGQARRMRCNTPLMNSWHSFSPNGRWLVFSSKARSPYTQMYLTHIDKDGRDSPPILIEDATAANRAVNIPEFVNLPPNGLMKIDVPAVEFYRVFDHASELSDGGDFEAAVQKWRQAAQLGPDNASARLNLGIALAETDQIDEAIIRYREALALDPGYAEVYNNLGSALARQGKLDEAIEHYRKSAEIDPESAEVHNNLAVALVRTGRLDEAIDSFRRAVEIKPGSAEFHNNLGRALAGKGDVERSIIHLERALDADPGYLQAHNNLGLVLAGIGRLEEAIGHFRKVLEANPGAAAVEESLGSTLVRLGRSEEAIIHLHRAVELNPNSPAAHNSLGAALVWSRRPDEAIPHFEKALELNPRLTEAHHNLGDILHYLQGRSREALAHWREVLLADPNHVLVLQQTARVLATSPDASLRDGAGAVALAERAAEFSGGRDPAVLDTLAAAYAEAGRFPDAIATARRALALAAETNNSRLVEALEAGIALYGAGTPLRHNVSVDQGP